ncbi:MAG: hypothetical protein AB7G11_02405 [Phycisphaerales bacterium]
MDESEAVERLRDEADRERLERRDVERWLTEVKATLEPWWKGRVGKFDRTLDGMPTVARVVAQRIQEMEADLALFMEKCEPCNGVGWLWRDELKTPRDPHDYGIDDTRYTCDRCHGKGRVVKKTADAWPVVVEAKLASDSVRGVDSL